MLFHPSLSPSHHLLNWSLIGAINDILSSPPDLQTGNPEITIEASWETYTFWYLDTPISYTSWNGSNMIEYDRIAFRSFCPLSLNWWMNFPKLLRYKRTIYMGTVPGCRSYEAFQYIRSPAVTSLLNCFTLWWLIALRCPEIFICIHLIYIYMHVYIYNL